MTDLKSALMELTERLCPKGEEPLKRGAAIVECAMLIIELEPMTCSDCGDNHGGATGCFPASSEDTNSQVSIHSEKDGNKHSGEEMRQQLHDFAMNYKAESAESRKECIDKFMEPIEEMHKEIETLKIQTEIAQEQSTGWMEKNEKVNHNYYELLWAVERKDPGETRHQTALRYIREAENKTESGSQVANHSPKK